MSSMVSMFTAVFVTLKLTDNIDWSWWWVLSPLWLPIVAVFVVSFLASVIKELLGVKK